MIRPRRACVTGAPMIDARGHAVVAPPPTVVHNWAIQVDVDAKVYVLGQGRRNARRADHLAQLLRFGPVLGTVPGGNRCFLSIVGGRTIRIEGKSHDGHCALTGMSAAIQMIFTGGFPDNWRIQLAPMVEEEKRAARARARVAAALAAPAAAAAPVAVPLPAVVPAPPPAAPPLPPALAAPPLAAPPAPAAVALPVVQPAPPPAVAQAGVDDEEEENEENEEGGEEENGDRRGMEDDERDGEDAVEEERGGEGGEAIDVAGGDEIMGVDLDGDEPRGVPPQILPRAADDADAAAAAAAADDADRVDLDGDEPRGVPPQILPGDINAAQAVPAAAGIPQDVDGALGDALGAIVPQIPPRAADDADADEADDAHRDEAEEAVEGVREEDGENEYMDDEMGGEDAVEEERGGEGGEAIDVAGGDEIMVVDEPNAPADDAHVEDRDEADAQPAHDDAQLLAIMMEAIRHQEEERAAAGQAGEDEEQNAPADDAHVGDRDEAGDRVDDEEEWTEVDEWNADEEDGGDDDDERMDEEIPQGRQAAVGAVHRVDDEAEENGEENEANGEVGEEENGERRGIEDDERDGEDAVEEERGGEGGEAMNVAGGDEIMGDEAEEAVEGVREEDGEDEYMDDEIPQGRQAADGARVHRVQVSQRHKDRRVPSLRLAHYPEAVLYRGMPFDMSKRALLNLLHPIAPRAAWKGFAGRTYNGDVIVQFKTVADSSRRFQLPPRVTRFSSRRWPSMPKVHFGKFV